MIKKIIAVVLSVFILSSSCFALTFPVDISSCKVYGNTVGITGWWSQERAYGYHRALDIPLPMGTCIKAPETGEVQVGYEYPKYDRKLGIWRSGFGNFVRIKIFEKKLTVLGEVKVLKYSYVLAHLQTTSRLDTGDTIGEGQVIGYVGSTGVVSDSGKPIIAPHLHIQKEDSSGRRINCIFEFGRIVRAYFNSTDKYTFTTLGGGINNN